MQNESDAHKLFWARFKAFLKQLNDAQRDPSVTAPQLKLTPWGTGKISFAPSKPHYLAVANYKVHWCAALFLEKASLEFTVYEAPISKVPTTVEHLRCATDQIRRFKDGLKLFEAENDLEWAELYLHEWGDIIYPVRDKGARSGETN